MAQIISKEMILQAIEIARPAALAILRTKGAVWGPAMANGFVKAPGVEKKIPFSFHAEDNDEVWNPVWGSPNDFLKIADKKLDVVMREKVNTSVIAKLMPWLLEDGEFMYVGGAYHDGIGATASGAKGWADECISEIVISNIKMLAHLEAERRTKEDLMEI
jgi:hypothetical protein